MGATMIDQPGPRIAAVAPPYDPPVDEQLRRMMPAGAAPIGLFRTFVRNLPMAEAIGAIHQELQELQAALPRSVAEPRAGG